MYFPDAERRDAGHIILREERIQYFLNWSDPPPYRARAVGELLCGQDMSLKTSLPKQIEQAPGWPRQTNRRFVPSHAAPRLA